MQAADGLFKWLSIKRCKARAPALGARELAVLDILWGASSLSAQQVLERMPGGDISLSTIQSTLERLQRKEIVQRDKRCRAFFYSARMTRGELIRLLFEDIAEEIAGGDMAPMVSGFMEFLGGDSGDAAHLLTHWRDADSSRSG